MPSRPNKISVPQKLTFAASIDLPKSDANSLEKVLDLFRDSQAFLIDLGFDCLITLRASTANIPAYYRLEIGDRVEIILTESFSQNGRKVEALHRFFVRNGFKSSIHFGGECLRSPACIDADTPVTDLTISESYKEDLAQCGFDIVSHLRNTSKVDLLMFNRWDSAKVNDLSGQLKTLGIELHEVSNSVRAIDMTDIRTIDDQTRSRLIAADIITIGDLLARLDGKPLEEMSEPSLSELGINQIRLQLKNFGVVC